MAQTTTQLRPVVAPTGIEMERPVRDRGPESGSASGQPGLLWRLILVGVGFGIALTGWMLVLTVFLSFLGLPLFMFGLALMQSQER
ncbi:MAG TPA: hypothetical protein VFM85_04345 [Actinomycetota bacterium]|nr:hypothetical protein [Actinomycetota bacterium]